MRGDEIIINSYRITGLTDEDKKIYETCNGFLEGNYNINSLEKFGLAVLYKEHNYAILHYDEGVTLIIRVHHGSKGLELKSSGTDAEKVRLASKTLLGIMDLEIKGKNISLRSNPKIKT